MITRALVTLGKSTCVNPDVDDIATITQDLIRGRWGSADDRDFEPHERAAVACGIEVRSEGDWHRGSTQLMVTRSENPVYLWRLAGGVTARIPAADFANPSKVQTCLSVALIQAGSPNDFVPSPSEWSAIWSGRAPSKKHPVRTRGLRASLCEAAITTEDDLTPFSTIFDAIASSLQVVYDDDPRGEMYGDGAPTRYPDGSVAFAWNHIFDLVMARVRMPLSRAERRMIHTKVAEFCGGKRRKRKTWDGHSVNVLVMEKPVEFFRFVDSLSSLSPDEEPVGEEVGIMDRMEPPALANPLPPLRLTQHSA